jgi:riboflavin kinase/FMN adenylyltransferase
MDIVRFWRGVPASLKGAVLAIGNFDGVHRGHQAVLREAMRIAKAEGRRAGAVVFEPHPREFFTPEVPFFRLTPLPLKLELLQALGLDQTFVIPFDRELSSLSAAAFATDVVGSELGASHVVVGHDFSYGKGRTGTTEGLAALGRTLGFGVDVVSPVGADEGIFSSSRIREHLRAGEVRDAAEQLGFWWRVRGRVGKGAGRGKALGFPTLNLALDKGQDIRHGIYAMRVDHGGCCYHAAGYVGTSPTFGDSAPVLEAYLLDFAGDLYGEEVEVEFIAFLREDRTFAGPEALAAQMREDCDGARAVLARIEADDPMRRFPLGRALQEPALDCKEPGC